jgi:hypothetical protein
MVLICKFINLLFNFRIESFFLKTILFQHFIPLSLKLILLYHYVMVSLQQLHQSVPVLISHTILSTLWQPTNVIIFFLILREWRHSHFQIIELLSQVLVLRLYLVQLILHFMNECIHFNSVFFILLYDLLICFQ